MADVEKFGRIFSFDGDTPADVQEKRILNWMRQNAPDELPSSNSQETTRSETPQVERAGAETQKSPRNSRLALLASSLLNAMPGANLLASTLSPAPRLGDVDTYRTLAQGALPYSDEAIAGVRALTGDNYDTALTEERQGVKDYAQKYGEGDKTITEILGAVGTVPLTMGAGLAAAGTRGGARLAQLALKHPWLSSALTGGTAAGVAGFGAGEEDFGSRAGNAGMNAAIGTVLGPFAYAGVRGIDKAGRWLNTDNKVADYLRKRGAQDRADTLKTDPRTPMTPDGDIDINSPEYVSALMRDLRKGSRENQALRVDAMPADLFPGTTEALVQKPGQGTGELATNLLRRQYNPRLDEITARETGQFGRVGDAFDTAFGTKMFKDTEDQLLNARKAAAKQGFEPAYRFNVRSPEIDDALDRLQTLPGGKKIWENAKAWADAERRAIGGIDATGNLRSYNTQFLHDIKRSLDEYLGEVGGPLKNARFNDVPYMNVKKDLNEAIMAQNGPYKSAMQRYGDDSELINALKKGREEVFVPGSIDKTGAMDDAAIKSYLNDATIPQAQKDLFMVGAARALREKVLGSNAKGYTHNWADFTNNPDMEKRLSALVQDGKGTQAWDLLRSTVKKESENYKNMQRALGNSRTNARQELMKEMEGMSPDMIAALGLAINPKAPSGWRGVASTVLDKVSKAEKMANETAKLLAKKGPREGNKALRRIEQLLERDDRRRGTFKGVGAAAPGLTGYAWPYRED